MMTRQLLSATKEGLLEQSQYGSGSPRPARSPNPDSRGFWTSKQWRSTRMVSFQHHISDLFAACSHFASVLGSFEAVASSWHSLLYQDPAKSHATLQGSMSSQGKGVCTWKCKTIPDLACKIRGRNPSFVCLPRIDPGSYEGGWRRSRHFN